MPSNWLSIDSNFPSFTGGESPEQQIRALHNYLFQLREGLQYSLQNLTADNFNATALQNLSNAQKNEVTTQLEKVYALLNQMSAEISSLSGRVTGTENLPGRITSAEEEINQLKDRATDTETEIGYLDKRITDAEEDANVIKETVAALELEQGNLGGRVDAIEERLPRLEQAADDLEVLQETVNGEGGLQERTQSLEDAVAAEGGLQEQVGTVQQDLQKISGTVQVAEDGSATVGAEGKPLFLVGQIYINGVLYEQGGTT